MKLHVAMFYHSLVSDWNHGNAHFLRGIATELQARGHEVRVFEPENGWSRQNLLRDYGPDAIRRFEHAFPHLRSETYRPESIDLEHALDGMDLVLVHEWNEPALVAAVGRYRREHHGVRVFFHDTHHRAITAAHELDRFDLSEYDGVLAYGESLRQAYLRLGWGRQVHVWHEAADIRTFHPHASGEIAGEVVWIGNWGDDERTEELRDYFLRPVRDCGCRAEAYGVRYPESAQTELQSAGIAYRGWVPNFEVPQVFSRFKATIHVPRRPYTRQLPGIPTIRPFEALACGIPLVSAPWDDTEGLFHVGRDFLMAKNRSEMTRYLTGVLNDAALARSLRTNGLETILSRHTCAHRVNELMTIYEDILPAQIATASAIPIEVHP